MRNTATNQIGEKRFGVRVYTYTKIIFTNLREFWCGIALGVHCTKPEISHIYSVCFIAALDAGAFCYNLIHTL